MIRPHLPAQVGTLQITYDGNGNPIARHDTVTGVTETLVWDDANRLVQVSSPDIDQHDLYDSRGLRVARTSGGDTTVFASQYFDDIGKSTGITHIFAGPTRIASLIAKYPGGESPAPSPDGAAAYYFHGDDIGSTGVVTDATATVTESHEYFSDGELWIDRASSTPVNGYLFSGKPFDKDTGFYDYGQRFYDPRSSLWLGIDPLLVSSPETSVGEPKILSPLAFSGHNAARFYDPDGRGFWSRVRSIAADGVRAIGFVGGAAVGFIYGGPEGAVVGAGFGSAIADAPAHWIEGTPATVASQYNAFTGGMVAEMGGAVAGKLLAPIARRVASFIGNTISRPVGPAIEGAIEGAAKGGSRSPINPNGGRQNCVYCVAAFFNSIRKRVAQGAPQFTRTVTTQQEANAIIRAQTGVKIGNGEWNALSTAKPEQYFIVYPKTGDLQKATHVLVGVVRNGVAKFIDPQAGTVISDIASQKPFIAYPVAIPKD